MIVISSDDKNLNQLDNYSNFPELDKLDFPVEINDVSFFIKFSLFYSELISLKQKLENILNSSILSITSDINRIKDETEIRILKISNLRLELLINLIKNPNIINIKRKLIEIMIFHLYSENIDYFQIDKNYEPHERDIQELENLINDKLSKDKNNKNIQNDLKTLLDMKGKKDYIFVEKDKIIDKETKKNLYIAKSFLDFLKNELHPDVHISKEKGKFYLLPRNMFNSEVKSSEYLLDLKSILVDDNEKNEKKPKIVGKKKKGKKKFTEFVPKEEIKESKEDEQKINNFQLYNENKYLNIDEALNILFSFSSKCDFIGESAYKKLLERQNEFEIDLEKLSNVYKSFFSLKISSMNIKLNFGEEINKKIMSYVEQFEKEVIYKLKVTFDSLLKGEIEADDKIISRIHLFIESFISNCIDELSKDQNELQKQKQLIYYLKIKSIILEKIICFFETCNENVINILKEKEQNCKNIIETISKNLNVLKNLIERSNESKNEFQIYHDWAKVKNYSYDVGLFKLKGFYKTYIKKTLNLEMSYTYDSQFCLWAIKKGFADYFE